MLSLEEPADAAVMSPLYLVFTLPYSEKINLPLYEPSPLCGLSNTDLTYELTSESLPDWIIFDADARSVEVEIEETVTFTGSVNVNIDATYSGLSK